MTLARSLVLTFVLATLAALLGVLGGVALMQARLRQPPELHDILHRQLNLTAEQRQRLKGLERDHAARRAALEAEMRAANAQLAEAYRQTHAYTPQAQAAIDRFHRAMDALQTETMMHVIAMRRILTPDQTPRFDDTVVEALTKQGL